MYSWDHIKEQIIRVEKEKAEDELSGAKRRVDMTLYFEMTCAVLVGLSTAIFVIMLNYLIFVWILHLEF